LLLPLLLVRARHPSLFLLLSGPSAISSLSSACCCWLFPHESSHLPWIIFLITERERERERERAKIWWWIFFVSLSFSLVSSSASSYSSISPWLQTVDPPLDLSSQIHFSVFASIWSPLASFFDFFFVQKTSDTRVYSKIMIQKFLL
jgi:hypothetical protein